MLNKIDRYAMVRYAFLHLVELISFEVPNNDPLRFDLNQSRLLFSSVVANRLSTYSLYVIYCFEEASYGRKQDRSSGVRSSEWNCCPQSALSKRTANTASTRKGWGGSKDLLYMKLDSLPPVLRNLRLNEWIAQA